MYQVIGLLKIAELDSYKEGCIPGTTITYNLDVNFSGKTQKEVIDKICSFLGLSHQESKDGVGFILNSCEEPGRIDFQLSENAEGQSPTDSELKKWVQGTKALYSSIYVAKMQKVEKVKAEYL